MPISTRFAAATMAAAIFMAGAMASAQDAPKPDATAQRCDRLAALYDHYANQIEKPGLMNRNIGVDLCKHGRYAEGIAELEKALALLGFTAPK